MTLPPDWGQALGIDKLVPSCSINGGQTTEGHAWGQLPSRPSWNSTRAFWGLAVPSVTLALEARATIRALSALATALGSYGRTREEGRVLVELSLGHWLLKSDGRAGWGARQPLKEAQAAQIARGETGKVSNWKQKSLGGRMAGKPEPRTTVSLPSFRSGHQASGETMR